MTKPRRMLDSLSQPLRDQITELHGDPDFVVFLLGWYGLLPVTGGSPPHTWPYWSSSRQRREKRRLQKEYGPRWKEEWKAIKSAAESYRPLNLTVDLFGIEPSGPKSSGAPFKREFWMAVCDAKQYFVIVAGRPHWPLIGQIFKKTDQMRWEWYKRKTLKQAGPYSGVLDDRTRWKKVHRIYRLLKPVILKVLSTGIPIYCSPHKEEAEQLIAQHGLGQLFESSSSFVHVVDGTKTTMANSRRKAKKSFVKRKPS